MYDNLEVCSIRMRWLALMRQTRILYRIVAEIDAKDYVNSREIHGCPGIILEYSLDRPRYNGVICSR